jgi:hypothetical protein
MGTTATTAETTRAYSRPLQGTLPSMSLKDAFGAFKRGFQPGPTEVGTWRERERFGRLQGVGEVSGGIELPQGEFLVSIEDYRAVDDLEVELTGPDGSRVSLERHKPRPFGGRQLLVRPTWTSRNRWENSSHGVREGLVQVPT